MNMKQYQNARITKYIPQLTILPIFYSLDHDIFSEKWINIE